MGQRHRETRESSIFRVDPQEEEVSSAKLSGGDRKDGALVLISEQYLRGHFRGWKLAPQPPLPLRNTISVFSQASVSFSIGHSLRELYTDAPGMGMGGKQSQTLLPGL